MHEIESRETIFSISSNYAHTRTEHSPPSPQEKIGEIGIEERNTPTRQIETRSDKRSFSRKKSRGKLDDGEGVKNCREKTLRMIPFSHLWEMQVVTVNPMVVSNADEKRKRRQEDGKQRGRVCVVCCNLSALSQLRWRMVPKLFLPPLLPSAINFVGSFFSRGCTRGEAGNSSLLHLEQPLLPFLFFLTDNFSRFRRGEGKLISRVSSRFVGRVRAICHASCR